MADLYVKKFDMINPFVVASSPATQGALNVLKSAKMRPGAIVLRNYGHGSGGGSFIGPDSKAMFGGEMAIHNIGSADDRKKILDGALAAFGRVDVLVNNAGVAPKVRADLLDMSEESFDYVVGINTKGNMFLTQLVAKQMISQEPVDGRKGVIVNVSSCSSVVSSTNRGEYCVSKAGISMLTTLYADRLAAEGILVNEVRPGVIATDMTSKVQGKYDALIEKGTFPIARWGTPEDVAGAVSLLCSPRLRYTTGNYIDVDGGFHIQRL